MNSASNDVSFTVVLSLFLSVHDFDELIICNGFLQKLRGELDKLLNKKIEEPGFDISMEGKGVVAAAVELLHSHNVRY